ncbi:MAG: hypothetical protein AB7L90_10655 [Hyphomicrobiaceae bacterium]
MIEYTRTPAAYAGLEGLPAAFELERRDWLLTRPLFDREDVSAPPLDVIVFFLGLLRPFDSPSTETPSDEPR